MKKIAMMVLAMVLINICTVFAAQTDTGTLTLGSGSRFSEYYKTSVHSMYMEVWWGSKTVYLYENTNPKLYAIVKQAIIQHMSAVSRVINSTTLHGTYYIPDYYIAIVYDDANMIIMGYYYSALAWTVS